MPKVNPHILRWARETAGLEVEPAAKKLGLRKARGVGPADRLRALENGEEEPSRPLLVKMASQYRRPLVAFYMSAPPAPGARGEDFRTLPETSTREDAQLAALIRDVRARQALLKDALLEEEETRPLAFVGSMDEAQGVAAMAGSIQETLGLSVEDFRRAPNSGSAFQVLRSKAEASGIFVLLIGNLGSHHSAISVETFRGFVSADEIAPFIVINDQDARAAWSFTLLHELAHLWLGHTGVSAGMPESKIEQFCNDVAGELLLPSTEVAEWSLPAELPIAELASRVGALASERNLSRSMVAYKLYRVGWISHDSWWQLSSMFRAQWQDRRRARREKNRESSGGPSFYTVRRHRLGSGLIELVHRLLAAGELTTVKAGRVLGVKAQQVQSLVS